MQRRDFLAVSGVGAGLVLLPRHAGLHALTPIPADDRKLLADIALEAARSAGASYADVRIGRYRRQFVATRDRRISGISDTDSFGAGVRVIANGTWGFAASNDLSRDGIARAARQAVTIAKANSILQTEPVQLAPEPGYGEVSWRTPIEINAFEIPIEEKVELLMRVGETALGAGATFVQAQLSAINEQKYFANTDGTYADQDIHRISPGFTVTAVDRSTGRFQTRDALSAPMGMGWEYLQLKARDRVEGPATILYDRSYDIIEDVRLAAEQARQKHSAKSVTPGQYDLVLEPSHLFLTIHESVGHPLELDRVLGYEANYAGTSFATLDKWQSGNFRYGSSLVNFFADKTEPSSLGACGWDDEGVKTQRWDLVKDGVLVDYQAIRDQAHILGHQRSHGCCYADSWSSVQFQRMPNVSLSPGTAPLTPAELISGVDKGIYIAGRGSYSIDQQRYNFQFGGQLFYEISGGKIVGMLKDVAYQSNTQEFWNAMTATCDRRDWRLGGSFNDGKGEPGQSSAVSHGSSTTRFNRINVLNTARAI
ncbi:MAG: TldD/PmbA family protein [Gemmatimonadales bacterium]|nr:TldD/PmbA family protein [Gemmatimonadales bacterium]